MASSQVTLQKDLLVSEHDDGVGPDVPGDVLDLRTLLGKGRLEVLHVPLSRRDEVELLARLGVHQLCLRRLWAHNFGVGECLSEGFGPFQLINLVVIFD